MTAYWITTYQAVHDPEKGQATRTVVIEFPSVEAAVAAHDSEAYQEALHALDGGADRDMRVVPGA